MSNKSLKSLPHSLETEQCVLGAILLDPQYALNKVKDIISPDDFYSTKHGIIYESMIAVTNRGETLDTITLVNELDRTGKLKKVDGAYYIAGLRESVPTAGNVARYAKIVKEISIERQVREISLKISSNGSHRVIDEQITALIGKFQELQGELPENVNCPSGIKLLPQLMDDYAELLKMPQRRVNFGIPAIDRKIRYLAAGQVATILGWTGVGKTLFLLNVIWNYLHYSDEFVALFSLEMPGVEILERFCQMETGLWGGEIEAAFKDSTWRFETVKSIKGQSRLFVIDRPSLDWDDVQRYCGTIQEGISGSKLGLVVVDYLGLMSSTGGSLYESTSRLAVGMKDCARKLDVPLIVAVQVSGVEDAIERIKLSNARDSKTIAFSSDYVLALTREKENDGNPSNIMKIDLLKNRRGALCTTKMYLDPRSTKLIIEEIEQ